MKSPRDLTGGMRGQRDRRKLGDGFTRETFTLPVDQARSKAREILTRFPVGGYATIVERWRKLDNGQIEFTMRRLPTAD